MLFDVKQGKNMHVAYHVEMCLFTTAFDDATTPKEVIVTYTKDHVFDHPEKKVSAEALHVSLDPATEGLDEVEITMHSSPVVGYDMGEKYDAWFSERFGYEVKLLYIGGNSRKVLGNMPPDVAAGQQSESPVTGSGSTWLGSLTSTAASLLRTVTGAGYEGVDRGISFADVAPYLVISTKSWEDAQRRLDGSGEVVDISKFRPNIIVDGADAAFEEDYWAGLEIGDDGAKIILTQNCARCNSLNVDYDTGKVGEGESGKILKKLQSDRRVDPGAKWSPVFGRYGFLARIPEGKEAPTVSVGDEVRVVRRNKERTRFGKCVVVSLPFFSLPFFSLPFFSLPFFSLPLPRRDREFMSTRES
jgi:glycine hydroxymethyltransferase